MATLNVTAIPTESSIPIFFTTVSVASLVGVVFWHTLRILSLPEDEEEDNKPGIPQKQLTADQSNLRDQYSCSVEDENRDSWKIKSLWIFPIKSCHGVEVTESRVVSTGWVIPPISAISECWPMMLQAGIWPSIYICRKKGGSQNWTGRMDIYHAEAVSFACTCDNKVKTQERGPWGPSTGSWVSCKSLGESVDFHDRWDFGDLWATIGSKVSSEARYFHGSSRTNVSYSEKELSQYQLEPVRIWKDVVMAWSVILLQSMIYPC